MPPSHRRTDGQAGPTAAELGRRFDRHEERSDELHRDLVDMIRKLDDRTDRLSTRITVIFSVVAVLWSIFLVIAPVIRSALHI